MSDLTYAQIIELRGEVADLRKRVDELERTKSGLEARLNEIDQRLGTRVDAVERRAQIAGETHAAELRALQLQLGSLVDSVEDGQDLERANFMSLTHMIGVVARHLKVPKAKLRPGKVT